MTSRILIVYKQYRFEVLAVVALGLFFVVGSLINAAAFSGVHLPKDCDPYTAQNMQYMTIGMGGPQPTSECINASQQWLNIHNGLLMHLVPASPWFLPLVFGIVLGAPLVAREVENGTAAVSWSLAGSRRRWLVGRMAAMLLLIVPLLVAVGIASDVLEGAMNRIDAWSSFLEYQGRGLPLVFWGIAAFAGTVALSSLTGRHVVTLLLATLICLTVRSGWDSVASRTYLQPVARVMATTEQLKTGEVEVNWGADLILDQRQYLHGEPWFGDINAFFNAHMVNTLNPDGSMSGTLDVPQSEVPVSIPFGISHDMYWPIVAVNGGILLAGSLFCVGVGLFWVGRRRPY